MKSLRNFKNGSVIPVVGSKLVFTPMCIKVWNISSDAKPHKDTFKNSSVWFVQFFIILKAMYKNIAIIVIRN